MAMTRAKGKGQATVYRKLDTIPCFNTFTVGTTYIVVTGTASERGWGGGGGGGS
jgi:hypothetical protein